MAKIELNNKEKEAIIHALAIERDIVRRGKCDRYGTLTLEELDALIIRLGSPLLVKT